MRRIFAAVGASGLAVAGVAMVSTSTATAATTTYVATLNGTNEVPPNASGYTGTATATVDDVANQVCVSWTVNNPVADPQVAAHIHTGAAGVNGPVLLTFSAGTGTCVTTTSANIAAIMANPAGFYFNVHTETLPGGAVRGQLALRPAGSSTTTPATPTTTAATVPTTTAAPTTTVTVAPVVQPRFTG